MSLRTLPLERVLSVVNILKSNSVKQSRKEQNGKENKIVEPVLDMNEIQKKANEFALKEQ